MDLSGSGRGRFTRIAVVVCIGAAGTLLALGSLLAIVLELDGFGAPSSGPRAGYLIGLCAGLTAAVAVPLIAGRALLPRTAPGIALIVAAVLMVGALSLLGTAWSY